MIDRRHIGFEIPSHSVAIEWGRLRFFAKAIGECNQIYLEETSARQAGHRSLPVPPTFLFSLDLERPNPFDWFDTVGLVLARILHAEQSFTYHQTLHAGDVVTFASRIVDIYDKKGGALDFIVKDTKVTEQRGRHVADLRSVIVQRNA